MALANRTKLFVVSAIASFSLALLVVPNVLTRGLLYDGPAHETVLENVSSPGRVTYRGWQQSDKLDVRLPDVIPFKDMPRLSARELLGTWRFVDLFKVDVFPIKESASDFFVEFSRSSGHGPFKLEYVRRGTYRDGVLILDRSINGYWTYPDMAERYGPFEPYAELVPVGWMKNHFTWLIPKYLMATGEFVERHAAGLNDHEPTTPDGDELKWFMFRGPNTGGKYVQLEGTPFSALRELPESALTGTWSAGHGHSNSVTIANTRDPDWPISVTFSYTKGGISQRYFSDHNAVYRDGVLYLDTPYTHHTVMKIPIVSEDIADLRTTTFDSLHAVEIESKNARKRESKMLVPAPIFMHGLLAAEENLGPPFKDTYGRWLSDTIYFRDLRVRPEAPTTP